MRLRSSALYAGSAEARSLQPCTIHSTPAGQQQHHTRLEHDRLRDCADGDCSDGHGGERRPHAALDRRLRCR